MVEDNRYREEMGFKREQAGAENRRAENYLRLAQDREGRLAKSETAQEGRESTKFGWEEQDRQVKQALQQMDLIVRVSGSVQDQASHDQAIAQLQQMKVDTSKIPQAFDQNFWKRQQDLAISAADKIKRQWAVEDQKTGHKNALELQGAQDSAAMARAQAGYGNAKTLQQMQDEAAMARTEKTIQGQKDVAGMKIEDSPGKQANYIRARAQALEEATDSMGKVDQKKFEDSLQNILGGMDGKMAPKGGTGKGGWKNYLTPETQSSMTGGNQPAKPPAVQPQAAPTVQPAQAPAVPQNALRAKPENPMEFQQGSYTAPNGKVVNWEDIKDTAQKMWSATGIDQAANAIWKGLGFVGDASIDFVKWLAAQQAEARKGLPAYKGQ